MSQDNLLNKVHIKFIENELYMKAKNINRYLIENNSKPTKSTLDGADEIKAIKFLEKVMHMAIICLMKYLKKNLDKTLMIYYT